MSAGDLQDSLFADLPGERLVAVPPRPLSPVELALRTNLAIVPALLFRATCVAIEATETHAPSSAIRSCAG